MCIVLLDEGSQRDCREYPPLHSHLRAAANQIEAIPVRHAQVTDQHVGACLGYRLYRCGNAARCHDNGADSFQYITMTRRASGSSSRRARARRPDEPAAGLGTKSARSCVVGIAGFSQSSPRSPIRTARMGRRTVNVEPLPRPGYWLQSSRHALPRCIDNGKAEAQPGKFPSCTAVGLAKAVKDPVARIPN